MEPMFRWKVHLALSTVFLFAMLALIYLMWTVEETVHVGAIALLVIAGIWFAISLAEGLSTLLGRPRK